MLNSPDHAITAIVFPYEPECPWTVRVSFINRRTGKKTVSTFVGKEDYWRVHAQSKSQIALREYHSATHEPKPKFTQVQAPIIGKGKGKGKQKK
jgi:hypothetical protein